MNEEQFRKEWHEQNKWTARATVATVTILVFIALTVDHIPLWITWFLVLCGLGWNVTGFIWAILWGRRVIREINKEE